MGYILWALLKINTILSICITAGKIGLALFFFHYPGKGQLKKNFKVCFRDLQCKCICVLWQVFQQLLLIGKLDAVAIATSLFANWFWHILSSTSLARHKAIKMRHVKISVKMVSLCCESVH